MIATLPEIEYPETDGLPMAESTEQYDWIAYIKDNLEFFFDEDPMVFVAGDLFWYPVRGDNKTRTAPDTMVVFGRPKGPRSSYRQFDEEDIPPQVVFEILSPSNGPREMAAKFDFYERFGVEEYYIYDFEEVTLQGWIRRDDELRRIPKIQAGWTSPQMKVAMRIGDQLELTGPNGEPFEKRIDITRERNALRAQLRAANEREKKYQAEKQAWEAKQKAFEELLREKGIDAKIP